MTIAQIAILCISIAGGMFIGYIIGGANDTRSSHYTLDTDGEIYDKKSLLKKYEAQLAQLEDRIRQKQIEASPEFQSDALPDHVKASWRDTQSLYGALRQGQYEKKQMEEAVRLLLSDIAAASQVLTALRQSIKETKGE